MGRFCITFPLVTEKYQEDILHKRFEIGRKLYNSVLSKVYKRYNCMIETKAYRQLQQQIEDTPLKLRKPLYEQLKIMHKQYRLSESSLHSDVKEMQHRYKENIDSNTSQTIASRVWIALETVLFGDGKEMHFKKYGHLNSLSGKSQKQGLRFKNNCLVWNGLVVPVKIDYNNPYEYQAMQNDICFCKVKRRFVKCKYKYYLQITFKGIPPIKINKDGEITRTLGYGTVGLDIGTQTLAISSDSNVKLIELADRVQNIENQKRRLQRYMDRSKRANNPNNFNPDGTIKKQGRKKVTWIKSNRYLKAQAKVRELFRKQADIREYQHQCLSSYIISLGDVIKVEDMNFKGLQRRTKKTEKNAKGKFKKKKRFGKSLANKAPAKLLTLIDSKLKFFGTHLIKVNTREVKASQYNHIDEQCKKKKLSQRWNYLNGAKVQRDMYSAFLIKHVDDDLKTINKHDCDNDFEQFLLMHDLEVQRLTSNYQTKALRNVI